MGDDCEAGIFDYSPIKELDIADDVGISAQGCGWAAILKNGTVMTGSYVYKEKGSKNEVEYSLLDGVSDASEVSVGNAFTLILHKDGSLSAIGNNRNGQFGDGTQKDSKSPVKCLFNTENFKEMNFGGVSNGI